MTTRALVLGGGVCGLAAACRLLELNPGWQVTVLEAAGRPGGLAASWRVDEFQADLGPHRVFTELPEIEALLPELISREESVTVQRRSQLLLGGHFYEYPVKAGELLRQMGPLRMAALGASAAMGKAQGLLRTPANYEQAMTGAFGRGVYDLIIGPYTQKVWKADPASLSAEIARVRVSAGNTTRLVGRLLGRAEKRGAQTALSSFAYIRGGAEGLVRSLTRKAGTLGARIETGVRVEGFRAADGRVTAVELADGGGAREADMVVSTIPVTDLADSLNRLTPDPDAVSAAQGLVFIGLVLVGLVLRRDRMTPNTWIYFPGPDLVFNRAYEPKNFDPGMAPPGRTMGVFEVTARWDSDLWREDDESIAGRVREDAIRAGVVRAADVEAAFAIRVPHTYPLYTVDYRDRLQRVFGLLRRQANLLSTGRQGLFNHNNMDHSMLMGIRAAEEAARGGDAAGRWYDSLGQFDHFRIVD